MAKIDRYFTEFKVTPLEKRVTRAIRENDLAYINKFIAAGDDVNLATDAGGSMPRPPLVTLAASLGHSAIVEALLKAGANPHLNTQLDALAEASVNHHEDTVKTMIKCGVDPQKSARAVEMAVKFCDIKLLKALADKGADISDAVPTVLMNGGSRAADREKMLEALLERGANPDALCFRGFTSLMEAQTLAEVRLLVEHHADVNYKSPTGKSVLERTIERHFDDPAAKDAIIQYLLDHDADPKAPNKLGKTAIDIARECRDVNTLLKLDPAFPVATLPSEAEVKAFVHAAGQGKDMKGVEDFLGRYGDSYVDSRFRSERGTQTAFDQACLYGNLPAMKLLAAHGADVNYRSLVYHYNYAPLDWAIDHERPQVAKLLIKLGAEFNAESARLATNHRSIGVLQRELDLRDAREKAKADPNAPLPAPLPDEISEFHAAVREGDIDGMRDFLSTFGKDRVNVIGYGGSTALSTAAGYGQEAALQELLAAGATVTRETLMETLTDFRQSDAHLRIFKDLADRNPQLLADDGDPYKSFLMRAVFAQNKGAVAYLLEKGVDMYGGDNGKIMEEEAALHVGNKEIAAMIRAEAMTREREATEPGDAPVHTAASAPKPARP